MKQKFTSKLLLIVLIGLPFTTISLAKTLNFNIIKRSDFSSSLNEDIVFHYDHFFSRQEFFVELTNLELDYFNSLTLFFFIDGNKTNYSGLEITFIINTTEIRFSISPDFQNQFISNFSKAFSFSEQFSGNLNISIICEGQANIFESGSLTICDSTTFEPISLPKISDTVQYLPLVPDWLILHEGQFSTRREESDTAFYSVNDEIYVNITVSFFSSYFSAFTQYVSIIIDGKIITKKEFTPGENNTISIIIPANKGMNIISVEFEIDQPSTDIEITNIRAQGQIFASENSIPEGVLDWIHWEEERFTHIFDLSYLKPSSNTSENIINIHLECGFLGLLDFQVISFNIKWGGETITQGTLDSKDLSQYQFSLTKRTYTRDYDSELTLTIDNEFSFMSREGTFFIFNTSRVEIDSIVYEDINTSNQLLLINELEVNTEEGASFNFDFYKVYANEFSNTSMYNISLMFDVYTAYEISLFQIIVKIEIGKISNFEFRITEEGKKTYTKEIILYENYHEVRVSIIASGNGTTIIMRNFVLEIVPIVIPRYTDNSGGGIYPGDNWFGKRTILGLEYGLIILFLIQLTYRWGKKKESRKKRTQNQNRIKTSRKQDIGEFLLLILVVTSVFLFCFLWLFGSKHHTNSWRALVYSIILSITISYPTLFLFEKYLLEKNEESSRKDSSNRVGWVFKIRSFLSRIIRMLKSIGITVLVFFYSILNIFSFYSLTVATTSIKSFADSLPYSLDFVVTSYYFFFSGIVLSIFASYYILKLAFNVTFFEDNLRKAMFLGLFAGVFLALSWGFIAYCCIIYLIKIKLSILWTLFVSFIHLLVFFWIYRSTKRFVESKSNELEVTFLKFLRLGKWVTKPQELKLALSQNIHTRVKWIEFLNQSPKESESVSQESQELLEKSVVEEKRRDILPLDVEVRNKICFININEKTGKFQINTEFKEVLYKLKNGLPIRILNRDSEGEEKITDESFDYIADSSSSFRILTEALFDRIRDLIKETNKIAERYWRKQKIKYKNLNPNAKRAHLSAIANRVMVELSVTKIFTKEQFDRDAVLFWNDNYDSFKKDTQPLDLLTTYLSSSLKGELAVIMVFLQSLIIMKETDSYELDYAKFNLIRDEAMNRRREIEEEKVKNEQKNYVLTDYCNPFIRLIYSTEETGTVQIAGWEFISPEEISYLDSIWNNYLPFYPENKHSIVNSIKTEWKHLGTTKGQLASIDLGNKTSYQLQRLTKKLYGVKTSLIALYVHLKYYRKLTADQYKKKIREMIQNFPTSDSDWALFAVDRQIQLINRGQDLFCDMKYLLMEVYGEEADEIEFRAIANPDPRKEKWLREGRAEIEVKSGWYLSPKALEADFIRYTNDPSHASCVYLSEDSLHRVADVFIRKEYDLWILKDEKYGKLSSILPKTSSHRKVVSELKGKEFYIIYRGPERVNISTAISCQKHLLRRLINATQFDVSLTSSIAWFNALTAKEKKRNKNFVELVKALIEGEEKWKGLKLQPDYGNYKIREIFSEYFTSILYYNVLLFASGLPVLKFNPELLMKGYYLPQTVSYKEEKKTVQTDTDSSPTYVSINGKLQSLVMGSENLSLKLKIPTTGESLIADISPNSFTKPITVKVLTEQGEKLEEQLVYALRVTEHNLEKLIVLDKKGHSLKKIVYSEEGEEIIYLDRKEKLYGAVAVENDSLFENSLARHKLTQLLIVGGEHYDGSTYEAMIDLYNKLTLNPLTNEEKKTPFLFFQIVSATEQRGQGQYEGLTSPIRHQIKKARKDYKYVHRPEILDVAFTSMDGLLSNVIDYSPAFGSGLEAYDTLYWNRSAREGEKDARHHVKGKNYYVNGLLNAFQIAFRMMFKVYTGTGSGGEHIRNYMWAEKRKDKYYFSTTKPTSERWKKIYVRIPLITTSKYTKSKHQYAIKTVAQRIPHILLSDNVSKRRLSHRRKISINFLLMMDLLNKSMSSKEKKNLTWRKLSKISKKYVLEKETQISAKDWARIIIILFPEILTAPSLVKSTNAELLKKNPLSTVCLEKINCKKPDAIELLKLFPPETRIDWFIRTPYHAFFSFFGYFLGCNWGIYNAKTNKYREYPKKYYSQPNVLIEPIYRVIVPWLISRAEVIRDHLNRNSTRYLDINKLTLDKRLPSYIIKILSLEFEELTERKTIVQEKKSQITIVEKMIWMFIRECQFIDTISFNLPEASKIIEHLVELFNKYQNVQGVAENINELFEGIQEKYFSF